MNWLWLNIPLGSLIFLAVAGIPMWLVLKHPDTRKHIPGARAAHQPDLVPVYAAANTRAGAAGHQQRSGTTSGQRRAPMAGGQRRGEHPREASALAGAR